LGLFPSILFSNKWYLFRLGTPGIELELIHVLLKVISAGIDNNIKIWDLRKAALETTIKGHQDTVTGQTFSVE
jgi:WD40 repeat protein